MPPREELPGPLPSEQLYDAYVALLLRCWAQQPQDRPTFGDVIAELR